MTSQRARSSFRRRLGVDAFRLRREQILFVASAARAVTVRRSRVSAMGLLTFAINVAAVVYLLFSKRLFGLRGGRAAYDAERRGEQLIEVERAAGEATAQ